MIETICKNYLAYLAGGDTENMLKLFAAGAVVHSPLYGDITADVFYPQLFSVTRESRLDLKGIYTEIEDPRAVAMAFDYHWTLENGEVRGFSCVDLFRFDSAGKITDLTIIYDTAGASRP